MSRSRKWWTIATASMLLTSLIVLGLLPRAPTGITRPSAPSVPENRFLPAASQDPGWPFVRGPHYDATSAEIHLADSWPLVGPPVLWSRALGQGYSGFVTSGSGIYTQTQTLGGQYLVCLDSETGRSLWEHRYAFPYELAGIYPGPRATPALGGGRVVFSAPSGLVVSLDALSGDQQWAVNVKEEYDGKGTDFGYASSPSIVGELVLLPVGGVGASMVALDARTGQLVWKAGDAPCSYTPAFPITVSGHRQVLGYMQNALNCFDLETGRELWSLPLSNGYDEHSAWPVYSEPYLLISGPFRDGSQLLELTSGPTADVRVVRQSPKLSNDVFSSVLADGHVYGFDLRDVQAKAHRPSRGTFRCIELVSGNELWSTQATGHAGVLVADGKLILFNDRGELILATATPQRYHELARAQIFEGEICWTAPSLHRGRLYLRNQSQAACVFLGEPELLETSSQSSAITVDQIPKSRYFDLAASILRVEPEYAFDIPSRRWLTSWFLWSLCGVLVPAGLLASATRWVPPVRMRPVGRWWLFWVLAFVFAAAGTTLLSELTSDFVFTWPACLFVAFQATVYQSSWRRKSASGRSGRWQSYATAAGFLTVCLAYFLICRRLSLVFEWTFLTGFPAALPVLVAATRWKFSKLGGVAWTVTCTALGYSAFYWSSLLLLAWRYGEG